MAFIMNFSSPMTLEDLVDRYLTDGLTNLDHIFHFEQTPKEWTVDEDAQAGDLIFFTCSKESTAYMDRLLAEIRIFEGKVEDYEEILTYALRQQELYRTYAGQLLAIGRLATAPYQLESPGYEFAAWTSNWYAKISDFRLLDIPLPFSAFEDFITFNTKGSRTVLTQEQKESLTALVLEQLRFDYKQG